MPVKEESLQEVFQRVVLYQLLLNSDQKMRNIKDLSQQLNAQSSRQFKSYKNPEAFRRFFVSFCLLQNLVKSDKTLMKEINNITKINLQFSYKVGLAQDIIDNLKIKLTLKDQLERLQANPSLMNDRKKKDSRKIFSNHPFSNKKIHMNSQKKSMPEICTLSYRAASQIGPLDTSVQSNVEIENDLQIEALEEEKK